MRNVSVPPQSSWRDVAAAWLLCLLPRAVLLALSWPNIRLDTSSVVFAHGVMLSDLATPMWPPAYELFAEVLWRLVRGSVLGYAAGHVAVHALVGVAVLSLCRSMNLSARAAWLAVAGVALLPYYLSASVRQIDVAVVITVCAGFTAVIVRWWTTGTIGAIGVAVAAMVLFLTRANALSLILMMYAVCLLRPLALQRRDVIASMVVFALALVAWSGANAYRFGVLTPFPSNVGLNLWDGNHPGADGDLQRRDFNPTNVPPPNVGGDSMYGDDFDMTHAAREYMTAHPLETVANAGRKFLRYWDWRLDTQTPHTRMQEWAYTVPYVVMLLLGVVGTVTLVRGNRIAVLVLAVVIIGYMAPHLLAYGMIRHRMSVEWAVLILAAVGADVLARAAVPTYSLQRND